jgi:hypothetical protein
MRATISTWLPPKPTGREIHQLSDCYCWSTVDRRMSALPDKLPATGVQADVRSTCSADADAGGFRIAPTCTRRVRQKP